MRSFIFLLKSYLFLFVISFILSSCLFQRSRTESNDEVQNLSSFKGVSQLDGKIVYLKKLLFLDEHAWSFDFLSEDEVLFTVLDGHLYYYHLKDNIKFKIRGGPDVISRGHGGLLDIAIDHKDEETFIYLTYSKLIESRDGEDFSATTLGRGKWKDLRLEGFEEIIKPYSTSKYRMGYGSRILLHEDYIYMTVGDRDVEGLNKIQKLDNHYGKVLRFFKDGAIPPDNPFVNKEGVLPEIYALGFRNPQGITIHPDTRDVWTTEHGPTGADEINRILKGKNYGWPKVSKELDPITGKPTALLSADWAVEPVTHYTPAIAPSGATFYTGGRYEGLFDNNLFIACLRGQHIRRLEINNNKVIDEQELFSEMQMRFRHVRVGPDDYLYAISDFSGNFYRINLISNLLSPDEIIDEKAKEL